MPQPLLLLQNNTFRPADRYRLTQKPPLHIAVANGFPPETYATMLAPFAETHTVFALPPRALWHPSESPRNVHSWNDVADDLLTGFETFNLKDIVAVGHSFGGIATLIAASHRPEIFRAVILLDPTVFMPRVLLGIWALRTFGSEGRMPLVSGALNRRAHFADLDEAYTYWRGKGLFRDWSDSAVRTYAESMTQPADDGSLALVWSPAWEARYYQTIATDIWRSIERFNAMARSGKAVLPILVLRGGASQTLLSPVLERLKTKLPNAEIGEIAGHGHLFPQSAPEATASAIEAWMTRKGV